MMRRTRIPATLALVAVSGLILSSPAMAVGSPGELPDKHTMPLTDYFDHPDIIPLGRETVSFDSDHPDIIPGGIEQAAYDGDHPDIIPNDGPDGQAAVDADHSANLAAGPRGGLLETPGRVDDTEPIRTEQSLASHAARPSAFPNPSSGVVTVKSALSQAVSVEVYDVNGRRLADLRGSSGTADWDGRDQAGRRVPPGVYFARVQADGSGARTVRIVRR